MKVAIYIFLGILFLQTSCTESSKVKEESNLIQLRGLYSFGPELKEFLDCETQLNYYVVDSADIEMRYANFKFEKPYEPVYVEIEAYKIAALDEGVESNYDSILVVKNVINISQEIPPNVCN
jgi:copper homeostasis protein (lipoprotein)